MCHVGMLLAFVLFGGAAACAQDPVTVDPGHYEIEFENDRVRVLRIHVGPHEKTAVHEHPPSVAVWLTGAYLRMTLGDGRQFVTRIKAGRTEWGPGGRHAGENLGDSPFELIEVELKGNPPPDEPAPDVTAANPSARKIAEKSASH